MGTDWFTLELSQYKKEGKFICEIKVDNEVQYTKVTTSARVWKNVKVEIASDKSGSASGQFQNFRLKTINDGCKSTFVAWYDKQFYSESLQNEYPYNSKKLNLDRNIENEKSYNVRIGESWQKQILGTLFTVSTNGSPEVAFDGNLETLWDTNGVKVARLLFDKKQTIKTVLLYIQENDDYNNICVSLKVRYLSPKQT